jgi:hypothetical protein
MQKLILGASSLKFEERDPVTLRMIALQWLRHQCFYRPLIITYMAWN